MAGNWKLETGPFPVSSVSKTRSLSTDYLETGNSKSDLRIALAVPGSENEDYVESMMKMSYLELAAKILLINVNVAVNRG